MNDITLIPYTKKRLSDHVENSLVVYIHQLLDKGQTKVPPEVDLAAALNVSRTTIRKALSTLEERGVIQRIHGKGTFINPNFNQLKLNLSPVRPLADLIESAGYKPGIKQLYNVTTPASPLIQSALNLSCEDSICTICRVYYADEKPVIICVDDIPEKYLKNTQTEETDSTFDLILKSSGVVCTRDEATVSVADSGSIYAVTEGRKILDCESALYLQTINYNYKNEPIFVSRKFFDTNYLKFHMTRPLDVYSDFYRKC